MKPSWLLLFIMTASSLLMYANPVIANSGLIVDVEMINALRDSTDVDPELSGLADEVGPVLNFKGFKLLKKSQVRLKMGETEELFLSQEQRLTLKLDDLEAGQARLSLKIFKNRDENFGTTLIIFDNGSAIIGGPKLKKGVMLLRVHGKIY